MATLLIRDERTGTSWRIWPEPENIAAGSIHETGSYLFELQDVDADTAELLIDGRPLEALRASAGTSRWRWLPGFFAGSVDGELRLESSNPRRFEIVTDPDLRKLTRANFDVMVREVLEDTFALFSLSSFRRSVARGNGAQPPAIARLEFLRSRVDALERVVSGIARRPRHTLTVDESAVAYHRASRATGPEILKSFRTSQIRSEAVGQSRLPVALKKSLPSVIRVQRRRNSLDIPEHRQMRACLIAWSGWLNVAGDKLRTSDAADPEIHRERQVWASRCRRLSRRLNRMAHAHPFSEAGGAVPRLLMSALFRRDPEYRRFFQLWQDMNRGIAAVFGDHLDMPLARTFELYELWCFLRLVRAAVEEFGPGAVSVSDLFITDARGGVTVAAGAATVHVGDGWKICFQKKYREFWVEPDGRGSFSREMNPDVAFETLLGSNTDRVVVLDAKYRIEKGLNDSLSSIHTYRDALVRQAGSGSISGVVRAAYILTPHIPDLCGTYRETPLPGRLFHPEYRQNFSFGALSMLPGMSSVELRGLLRAIVGDVAA